MIEPRNLRPTERKILELLSDGEPHSKAELRACIEDELAADGALHWWISRVRKALPNGHIIVCEFRNRKIHYRWALRLMSHFSPRAA